MITQLESLIKPDRRFVPVYPKLESLKKWIRVFSKKMLRDGAGDDVKGEVGACIVEDSDESSSSHVDIRKCAIFYGDFCVLDEDLETVKVFEDGIYQGYFSCRTIFFSSKYKYISGIWVKNIRYH